MSLRFRTKIFLASLGVAAAALVFATVIIAWQLRAAERDQLERRLIDQALLIAELLAQYETVGTDQRLDMEADRLGQYIDGRVTFIADDGRVIGDSTLDGEALLRVDNHLDRPEVQLARERQLGVVERYSTTTGLDMLYAAVPTGHPRVGYVRVSRAVRPLWEQLQAVAGRALVALVLAVPLAVALAWALSAVMGRRVQAIDAVARRYAAGDLTGPTGDYGTDEIGTVARVLDTSVQELGKRIAELSRDRARMAAILSGMVEGVLVVDRGGRLQIVNDAAQDMLKVEGGAIGRPYVEVIRHPDIAAQLGAALAGGDPDSRELTLARDPGRTFVARAAPVAEGGGGGAVLVLHDITDLRRADQVRRDFVANVSHELRTPLTAIRGYVEALMDGTGGEADRAGFLEIIARHSARMERLVKDLLRLARLDARQEPLDRGPCDLRQLFDAVVADLAQPIEAKRQRVAIAVDDDACSVVADPAKLHDIVRNLVENAVNYSPEEADISLSARREDSFVRLEVADSGPGIPPEDLSRVFERFYRVDKSRSGPGTGLGLAIVKHLVELHGGEARVENRPEGGTRVTVRLRREGKGDKE